MNEKTYLWQGIDQEGMRVNGEIDAENSTSVENELIKQNISPLKIYRKFKLSFIPRKKKISAKHIIDFSRQLATLTNSNIPLLTALNIIERSCEHLNLQTLIGKISHDIERGTTLSIALKKQSHYFDELFYNLIYVGEQSGTLDIMLSHIANYQEKTAALKRKVKKALFYPCAILLTAVIVTIILLIFVIPQLAELFHSFGAQLPIYTQFIIKLSTIIKNQGLFMLLGITGIIIILKSIKRRYKIFAVYIDKTILKIPIIGVMLKKAIIARFCRTLAITFNAGLPLTEALQIIATTCDNLIYQQAILKIQEQVATGQTIHSAMENNPLFPQRSVQMVAIGEESGSLDIMLTKIAEYYESEVDYLVDNLNNLLEPSIMVILGILIGGLIIGMYLPIFRLGTVI